MDATEKISNFNQAFDDIIFSQQSTLNTSQGSANAAAQQQPQQQQALENLQSLNPRTTPILQSNIAAANINQPNFGQNIYSQQQQQNSLDLNGGRNQQAQSNMFLDMMNGAGAATGNGQSPQIFQPNTQFNAMQSQNAFNPTVATQLNQMAQQAPNSNFNPMMQPQQQMMYQNQYLPHQASLQPSQSQLKPHIAPSQLNNATGQFQASPRMPMINGGAQPMVNNSAVFQAQRNMMMSRPATVSNTNFVNMNNQNSMVNPDQLKNHMQNVSKLPSQLIARNQPSFNLQNCSVNNNRLSFCVRRGNLIQPFRLDHNTNSALKTYEIRDIFYEELMWREDLDLQLRCFHHEDRFMRVNWPNDIKVEINDQKLEVDRTGDAWQQQPLLIKGVCHSGVNTMKISVSNCACSHLFILQLIHRPTILDVMTLIMTKQRLDVTAVQKKLKTFFSKQMISNQGEDKVDFIKVSRECPISKKPIVIPIRGINCTHLQCFDLESYLFLNKERSLWRCPVCFASVLVEFIEVDDFMYNLLKNANPFSMQKIKIYPDGKWIPDTGPQMTSPNTVAAPNAVNIAPTPSSNSGNSNLSQIASDNLSNLLNRQSQTNALASPIPINIQNKTQSAAATQPQQIFNNGNGNINSIMSNNNGNNASLDAFAHIGSPIMQSSMDISSKQAPSTAQQPQKSNINLQMPIQTPAGPTMIMSPNNFNQSKATSDLKDLISAPVKRESPTFGYFDSNSANQQGGQAKNVKKTKQTVKKEFSQQPNIINSDVMEFMQPQPDEIDIQESIEKAIKLQKQHTVSSNTNDLMSLDAVCRVNSGNDQDFLKQNQINPNEYDDIISSRYYDSNNDFLNSSTQNLKFGAYDEMENEFVMN